MAFEELSDKVDAVSEKLDKLAKQLQAGLSTLATIEEHVRDLNQRDGERAARAEMARMEAEAHLDGWEREHDRGRK